MLFPLESINMKKAATVCQVLIVAAFLFEVERF
jgi:hypothetical protein